MPAKRLTLRNFRCFESAEFEFDDACSLMIGPNGSGKTSIIEALSVFGLGRSFKTHLLNKTITKGKNLFSLRLRVMEGGLERDIQFIRQQAGLEVKVDGERAETLSSALALFPMAVLSQEGAALVSGPSEVRRKFLDYGVFHVKRDFIKNWRAYKKTLKQRNQLLITSRSYTKELASWDLELENLGNLLREYRDAYWQRFYERFCANKALIGLGWDLDIKFYPGWNVEKRLSDLLADNFERDKRRSYTTTGAHRSDLLMYNESLRAKDILSRGQQKLLYFLLTLTQVQLIADSIDEKVTVLVDDLSAEVDELNQTKILEIMRAMLPKAQFIMTSLEESVIDKMNLCQLFGNVAKFHVKQELIRKPTESGI